MYFKYFKVEYYHKRCCRCENMFQYLLFDFHVSHLLLCTRELRKLKCLSHVTILVKAGIYSFMNSEIENHSSLWKPKHLNRR